jgi:hypothetical protein
VTMIMEPSRLSWPYPGAGENENYAKT